MAAAVHLSFVWLRYKSTALMSGWFEKAQVCPSEVLEQGEAPHSYRQRWLSVSERFYK